MHGGARSHQLFSYWSNNQVLSIINTETLFIPHPAGAMKLTLCYPHSFWYPIYVYALIIYWVEIPLQTLYEPA